MRWKLDGATSQKGYCSGKSVRFKIITLNTRTYI